MNVCRNGACAYVVQGVVNGTMGLCHGLQFAERKVPARLLHALRSVEAGHRYEGGEIVLSDEERPSAVLLTVGGASACGDPAKQRWWHGVRLVDVAHKIRSVVEGEQVVALKPNGQADTEQVRLISERAASNGVPTTLVTKTYRCGRLVIANRGPLSSRPRARTCQGRANTCLRDACVRRYTPAFALIDFKIQGRTLPKLVVSIGSRPIAVPRLTLESLYVMVTRTREAAHLRTLYPLDDADVDKLLKLKCSKHLAAWERGYTECGLWDRDRCASSYTSEGPNHCATQAGRSTSTVVRPRRAVTSLQEDGAVANPFPMDPAMAGSIRHA